MSAWFTRKRGKVVSSQLRSGLFALAMTVVAACGGTDGNEGNGDNGGGASGSAGAAGSTGTAGGSHDSGVASTGGAAGASGGTMGAGGTGGSAMAGSSGMAGMAGTAVADAAVDGDAGGPRCGNGIKEGTEECDDSNTLDQDGCSSTCMLTRCCEACEEENCPVDNFRDPVSGKLVSQPTCAAFVNDKTAGGKLKRELCTTAQSCIVRTGCALDGPSGPLACYCGKGRDATQCKAMGPNGPCKQEIETGFESTSVDYVIGNLLSVSEASGAALNRAQCHHDFCTTPGAGGTHTPGACYRAPGTPIPACDIPPQASVDSGTADAPVDTGTTTGPDALAAGDAQGDAGSGVCTSPLHESTTCPACEASNCPHDPAGCSNGTCVSQPACDDFLTQPQRDACRAVLTCVRNTNCTAAGPLSCYCGTADATQCNSTTPPNANGICKTQIEAGFGSTLPSLIRGNLLVVSYPAGAALSLAQCDRDYCGADVLSDEFLHTCLPYCR